MGSHAGRQRALLKEEEDLRVEFKTCKLVTDNAWVAIVSEILAYED